MFRIWCYLAGSPSANVQKDQQPEMTMPHFLLKAGAAACALALLGFAPANATPRPALNSASSLTILAGDEENSEIENYEDPAADNGAPKDETGPAEATPEHHPEGADAVAPHPNEGGGSAERALESTVGGDGINAIQRESIPEK
jgi:hypothetical protein